MRIRRKVKSTARKTQSFRYNFSFPILDLWNLRIKDDSGRQNKKKFKDATMFPYSIVYVCSSSLAHSDSDTDRTCSVRNTVSWYI